MYMRDVVERYLVQDSEVQVFISLFCHEKVHCLLLTKINIYSTLRRSITNKVYRDGLIDIQDNVFWRERSMEKRFRDKQSFSK